MYVDKHTKRQVYIKLHKFIMFITAGCAGLSSDQATMAQKQTKVFLMKFDHGTYFLS